MLRLDGLTRGLSGFSQLSIGRRLRGALWGAKIRALGRRCADGPVRVVMFWFVVVDPEHPVVRTSL